MKGLKEMINRCARKESVTDGPCVVRKIGRHKTRKGHEMGLTTQIGEYEMDKISLDLGSGTNIFSKQTWKRMGRPMLQWSLV